MAVDNDVLIKAASYGLIDELWRTESIGVLGAARYVVAGRLARMDLAGDRAAAQQAAVEFIDTAAVLEPTDDELRLATRIETTAQRRGLSLDAGESQLAAILLGRAVPLFETGDKRAIRGFEALLDELVELAGLHGKLRSLEQIVLRCADAGDPNVLAHAICSEPGVDGEIEGAVDRALTLRRELEAFVVRDIPDAERKAKLLAQADAALDDARLLGDLVVGAALSQRDDADPLAASSVARHVRLMLDRATNDVEPLVARTDLRALAEDWLVERRRAVGEVSAVEWADRVPFHWALEFPEVRAHGGFDAITGNPPFQGGSKISVAVDAQYRDYLVTWLAGGVRGTADLIAYFFPACVETDTAEWRVRPDRDEHGRPGRYERGVGLDQLFEHGLSVHRAIASAPWPGGANLEMATIWARRAGWGGAYMLDRAEVGGITPALAVRSRVDGNAARLRALTGRSFKGSGVMGMGFVLSSEEARAMLEQDPRNAEVVKPFLIGEDLNQRPDGSPSRWVIDFRDWSQERAAAYPAPFARVEALVRPERARNVERRRREIWWQLDRPVLDMYRAISEFDRCIAITRHSKAVQPMFVPSGIVISEALAAFAYDDDAHFGLLSSGFHWWWAVTNGSTLETRVRYTPTDCFETFVQPELTFAIGDLGGALNTHRAALMLDRQEGLTKIYNRVHDPEDHADDIVRLRALHTELDHAVRDAYGWTDLDLGHGFHDTKFGTRFTFAPVPRQEVLDLLLELNHDRYAEEVRKGLHGKTKAKKRTAAPAGALTFGFGDV